MSPGYIACRKLQVSAGMNSGVMLFRRTPWMEEFLTKVAALGRIPEPELGKVQDPGISTCRHHCESCQDHHVSRVRDSIQGTLSVPSFCPLRGSPRQLLAPSMLKACPEHARDVLTNKGPAAGLPAGSAQGADALRRS